jgi:hypothetical protein
MLRRKLSPALLAAPLLLAASACLPQPDDPVEWVERPEAIIVQMREVSQTPGPPEPPSFTLYGDGTLIYDDPVTPERSLTEATLPPDAIEDLLEDIEETGFFNFSYEQPAPVINHAPTTYLYVNTKSGANAVSAAALFASAEVLGEIEDWSQFKKLQEIQERLQRVDPDEEGGRVLGSFEPERLVLRVARTVDLEPEGGGPWPFEEIDLGAAAPEFGQWYTVPVRPDDASRLVAELGMEETWGFEEGGALFAVALRPVLPYEENFPEFDAEG